MDGVTVTFLGIGAFALFLLAMSLTGGRLHIGRFRPRVGRVRLRSRGAGSHYLTLPAVAGFVGAFGFGGAIAAAATHGQGIGRVVLAVGVGLAAALPSAWLAGRLMLAAMNIHTDATLTSADLVGAMGVVITPIPVGGYGEVRLTVAGQLIKFNARADEALALGTRVFVIEVPTPSSVLVEVLLP
jgi:hypothetical protein